jgi:hypothetical protein
MRPMRNDAGLRRFEQRFYYAPTSLLENAQPAAGVQTVGGSL